MDRTQSNGWDIEVSHRTLGVTVKRSQFSVKIRHLESAHEEFLSGFSSRQQARQAADDRVDLLVRRPELLKQGGKRKRPVLPNAVTWQRELPSSLPKPPRKNS